jgi:hypothetical protein
MKTKQKQASPKWLLALLACALSCAAIWIFTLVSQDETDVMRNNVQMACIAVSDNDFSCNADGVMTLYADVVARCEDTIGQQKPVNPVAYAECLEGQGIHFR